MVFICCKHLSLTARIKKWRKAKYECFESTIYIRETNEGRFYLMPRERPLCVRYGNVYCGNRSRRGKMTEGNNPLEDTPWKVGKFCYVTFENFGNGEPSIFLLPIFFHLRVCGSFKTFVIKWQHKNNELQE